MWFRAKELSLDINVGYIWQSKSLEDGQSEVTDVDFRLRLPPLKSLSW